MKTEKTQHTPTPDKPSDICNCGELENLHTRLYGKFGNELAKCIPMTPAQFSVIVRAVNSHEALLDAAYLARVRLSRIPEHVRTTSEIFEIAQLNKAIAQAEGVQS